MYDDALIEVATEADVQLRANLERRAPYMAGVVGDWLGSLFGGSGLAEVFTRIDAFPMLLIPWWVDAEIGEHDPRLHRMLSYSSMSGYLFIRLIDNLMDGDAPGDADLLPALGFFHLEFIEPYRRLFPPEHPFWEDLDRIWLDTAEATMQDAALEEVTRSAFLKISSRKTGAAKIPVAAVCHIRRQLHVQPRWNGFVDAFGRWHQMHNDIFSWRKDAQHGASTYFLSEGKRRRSDDGLAGWVIEEGFSWGVEELYRSMADVRRVAHALESDAALAYLGEREADLAERATQVKADLSALLGLSTTTSTERAGVGRG